MAEGRRGGANSYRVISGGAGDPLVLAGTADPTAGGGVAAPEGSFYMRYVAAGGECYLKTGAADTAWTKIDPTAGAAPAYGMLYTADQAGTNYNFSGNENTWTKQASGLWEAEGPASGCSVDKDTGEITLPARDANWLVTYQLTFDNANNVTAWGCEFAVYLNVVQQAQSVVSSGGPASWDSTYDDPRITISSTSIVEASASDVISLYAFRITSLVYPSDVFAAQLTVTELR